MTSITFELQQYITAPSMGCNAIWNNYDLIDFIICLGVIDIGF